MKHLQIALGTVIILLLAGMAVQAGSAERIYGVVITNDGDEFEGFIRWDKNEGAWIDMLDGSKRLSKKNLRKSSRSESRKSREQSIEIFGIKIGGSSSSFSYGNSAQSGIRLRSVLVFYHGYDRAPLDVNR